MSLLIKQGVCPLLKGLLQKRALIMSRPLSPGTTAPRGLRQRGFHGLYSNAILFLFSFCMRDRRAHIQCKRLQQQQPRARQIGAASYRGLAARPGQIHRKSLPLLIPAGSPVNGTPHFLCDGTSENCRGR